MTQKKLDGDDVSELTVAKIKSIMKDHIGRFEIDLKDESLAEYSLTEKEMTEILIKHYKLMLGLMEKL